MKKGAFFILITLFTLCSHAATPGKYEFGAYDPASDASTTNSTVKNFTGSGEQINQNLTRPMMSTDSLTTFAGQQFSGQLSCPSSSQFMEIFIAPNTNGDISPLILKQDTDMDGAFDYTYISPVHASGVCANGIISCDPGSWDNCQAYEWVANSTFSEASFMASALSSVGGCYCVNNSCGNNLAIGNLSEVLGDLGGGAVGAVLKQNPLYSVSKVEVEGPTVTYYGQNTSNCGATGNADQTAYFTDPSSMALNATATSLLNDTFNLVTTSVATGDAGYEKKSCTVSRQIPLEEVTTDDIISYNGGNGGITSCGTGCLQMVLGTVGDNYWTGTCSLNQHNVSYWVNMPERIISATLINARFDDHIQVSDNGTLVWAHDSGWIDVTDTSYPPNTGWSCADPFQPGGCPQEAPSTPFCERSTSWDVNPGVDFTNTIRTAGAHDFKIRVAVAGGGEGYAYAQVIVDESCNIQPDQITDSCNVYEQDPSCTLETEIVDGVKVINNFNPTGLTPSASSQDIVGNTCTVPVTKNWWLKERTYHCDNPNEFDLTSTYERSATIKESASLTGYDDYRMNKQTGAWETITGNSLEVPSVEVSSCMKACKTTKPREAIDVAGLGPSEDLRNSNVTLVDRFYHECDANNVCQAGAGETIVQACQCIDDFAEATAIMQSMRMAGRDMICTSGIPQQLP